MMSLLIVVAVIAGGLVWVLMSPARIAAGIGLAYVTHPALTVWLTAALALLTLGTAGTFAYRNLTGAGWRLVTITTSPAPAGVSSEADREEADHG